MYDYFSPNYISAKGDTFVFLCYLEQTKDDVAHLFSLSYHGEFLDIWRSNFATFWSMQHYPTRTQRGEVSVLYFLL